MTPTAVCFWDGGFGVNSLIAYKTFDSEEEADAWIADRPQGQSNFYTAWVFPPPPITPPGSNLPVPVTNGQVVVALYTPQVNGDIPFTFYGTFASQEAAFGWISQRNFPGGAFVLNAQTPPS